MVGGLIMAHGDDNGLVIPPRLAPTQVVLITVREGEVSLDEAAATLRTALEAANVRVALDKGRGSFGRRLTDWELKGVPLRVEIGPRDLAEGRVTVVRRDTGEKMPLQVGEVAAAVAALLETVQADMLANATALRDSRTEVVESLEEAIEVGSRGFARLAWSKVGPGDEARLKGEALTVRCLQRADGSLPAHEREEGLTCIIAKSY
jgi:prolyl-tRNA synthetase